jgi:hypothetical protein
MITAAIPRLGLLGIGGTSGSLDFGFSTSAFQGSNGASERIRADDNNYSASLSFQTRTSGSDNSNMLTRMVIQSTGNVGINTTSPGSLLDVSGNVNRMSFTTNGTLTACNSTVSNLTVKGIVQSTLDFLATDLGFFCKTLYGSALDVYGFAQTSGGTVRSVISGTYSAGSYRVSKPFNTSYTSWTNLLTVDYNGNTAASGTVSGTNLNLNSNQIKIGYTANTPGSSVTLGRGWFSFSSAGWTAVSTCSTFCPVPSSGMDNWVGKLKVAVKNAQTTSPNTWYAEYTLNKLYGYNILVSVSQGEQTFGFPGCSIVASGGTG